MRILTLKRGVHPPDAKSLTDSKTIVALTPPIGCEMIYPLIQHIGTACKPTVTKDEKVLIGQKIADSSSVVSAAIHSSVSGTVKDFRKVLTHSGGFCNAIVIENDGFNKKTSELFLAEREVENTKKNYLTYSKDEYLKIIKEAGIVGLGGAGFPTHIKLNPPDDQKIDYIIVNAAECEPFLTTDHRILLEESISLVRGLEIMLAMHPTAKGIIAIETNKMNAIKKILKVSSGISKIEVVGLLPKYPQGSEKQLIYACTKRKVPANGLPSDVGCIVNNVATVVAIDKAVIYKQALIRKTITITGDAVQNVGNYEIPLGMNLQLLIDTIGGFQSEPFKIISGGPMMGSSMFNLDVPLTKTSSAILAFTKKNVASNVESTCIRCGRCAEYCPIYLMPLELNKNFIHRELELFEKNNGLDCIECGTCSYVCPAKRELTQSISSAKKRIQTKKQKGAIHK